VDGAACDRDGITVVTLPAAIDLDSAGDVQAALARALTDGVTVLVADMTATGYCTLEGVQALLRARRAALAAGAQFRLAAVAPAVQRILEITGTITLLGVDPGLDAARDGRESPAPG
jgi:anti-anti-sigma factor